MYFSSHNSSFRWFVLPIFLHYELSIFAFLSLTETGGLHATIFHVRISRSVATCYVIPKEVYINI